MTTPVSALGRLLAEVSWEGNARRYHEGGRGFENVLTVEVFQALDFLPRRFLSRIVETVEGGDSAVLKRFAEEGEQARFSLLPGDIYLLKNPPKGESPLSVQPDGIIYSPTVYCMLEAKRLRRGTFQPEQLAREFLAVFQEAETARTPLLLLVLPREPPVPVRGQGRLPLHDAVERWLPAVLKRAEGEFPSIDVLLARVDSIMAYTTWERVSKSVEVTLEKFAPADPSVRASITRIATALLQSIKWHE